MLEHSRVPPKDEFRVITDALNRTVTDIFLKMGMGTSDAEMASDVLVSADVRGVDSHSVSNILRRYAEMFNDKFVSPTPESRFSAERHRVTHTSDCWRNFS